MKIALVIGHRKGSRGAYGNAGVSEFDFYKELVPELLESLSDDNEFRVFIRKDSLHGYTERMKDMHRRIDNWGADISISFHFNASSKQYVNGHEILYCSRSGRTIAGKLDSKFDKYLDNNDRNLKRVRRRERGGGFLCRGRSVCILIEPFFASHQKLFIPGGIERDNLLSSLSEFINEL